MFVTGWLLVQTLIWYAHAHKAPVPPIAAALDAPTQNLGPSHGEEDPLNHREKRLLKYILPNSQSWMGGEDSAIPTGQEGSKRGYSNRNYLRFGRSDEEKRGGRNFLRFGRGDISDFDTEEDLDDTVEKRGRNFLRFGRNPSRNFLRFGRSDIMEEGPLEFAEELPVEDKRTAHKNYLRFGRGNRNFLRFGRGENRNFLRFGRSVDRQMSPLDCEEEENQEMASTASQSPVEPKSMAQEGIVQRYKRAASVYYGYAAPSSLGLEFQPDEEDIFDSSPSSSSSSSSSQEVIKRNYNPNRNYIRFGKRDGSEKSNGEPIVILRPMEYPRFVRAPPNNYIRFG